MRYLIAGAILMIAACKCSAYEFPDNPDRFMSVGVNLGITRGDGTVQSTTNPNTHQAVSVLDNGDLDNDAFGFDLRIPTSNSTTWTLSYARTNTITQLQREANTYQQREKFTANTFGVGLRVYFNK